MLNKELCLYQKGIVVAKLSFNDEGINHYKINLENNTLDSNNTPLDYDMPIEEIYNDFNLLEKIEWNQDEIILSNGKKFVKGLSYEAIIDGVKKQSNVWAQIGGPNHYDVVVCDDKIVGFIHTCVWQCSVLVLEGFEMLTPVSLWNDDILSKSHRGSKKLGTYYIPMRDDIKLATDVYLPADYTEGEKLPTILYRTPYNRKNFGKREHIYADRGYAVVVQDVRGRDESEGDFIAMYYEKNDGSDVLDWIAAQSWSDGNVGTRGASYSGFTQWTMAASGNPHLKAIISIVTSGSAFYDVDRRGGAINMGIMSWNLMMAEKTANFNLDEEVDVLKGLKEIKPIKDIPKKLLGKDLLFWDKFLEHPNYDEFWEEMTYSAHADKANVPSLVISGWYDDDLMGTVEAWEMNKERNRENQRIILGPWPHKCNARRTVGEYEFGPNAIKYDLDLIHMKWFDKFLKGIDNGVDEIKAEYYAIGRNEWLKSNTWPPANNEEIVYYLNKEASTDGSNGKLTGCIQSETAINEYTYDPENPPYHLPIDDECGNTAPVDYTELEKRDDVLVYTSEKFEENKLIAGRPVVELYASSSCVDTDFVARLCVVKENGKSYRLCDYLIRAKYRNSFAKPEPLNDGQVYKFTITMPYMGHEIQKGEKIRLHVTSAQDYEVFPNHNTGNDPAYDTEYIIADQKVYHGSSYPSLVRLPIVK